MKTGDSANSRFFQVTLCALPAVKLPPLLKQLSQHHSLLLPELTQLLAERSQPPFGVNYRMLTLPETQTNIQTQLVGTDALIFVVPPDPLRMLPECRAALIVVQQCLAPATPIAVLVDQIASTSSKALKTPIEELQLATLFDAGVQHLGIYPVCTQTGEGLYDALWWLTNLFLAKLEDELPSEMAGSGCKETFPVPFSKDSPQLPLPDTGPLSRTTEPSSLRPSLSDDYVFTSGETYFDRLFATVGLWKETWQTICQQPLKKKQLLLRYEQRVREVLQERSNEKESIPNDC